MVLTSIIPTHVTVTIGQPAKWKELKFWLEFRGYIRCSSVSAAGEFAEVGGSFLIWPRDEAEPFVLDRFGEVLERAKFQGRWLNKGTVDIPSFEPINEDAGSLKEIETTQPLESKRSFWAKLFRFPFFNADLPTLRDSGQPDATTENEVGQPVEIQVSPPSSMNWNGLYFPAFWVKHSGKSKIAKFPIEAWGWGDSEAEADTVAAYRVAGATRKAEANETDWELYGYGLGGMPLRERLLDAISKDSKDNITAALTRNRYGALILITSQMMMIDLDFPTGKKGDFVESFVKSTKGKLASETDRAFLLFRTAAGLRAICTNKIDRAEDPEAQQLMERVGGDPLYVRLCREQKCFRSRLTPKPWRINPPIKPPSKLEEGAPSDTWVANYEKHSLSYGVCQSLGWVGQQETLPEFFEALAIHNQSVTADDKVLA
jgi:hypothetical protein